MLEAMNRCEGFQAVVNRKRIQEDAMCGDRLNGCDSSGHEVL